MKFGQYLRCLFFKTCNFKLNLRKLRHNTEHQNVLLKFQNDPFYLVASRVIALCSSKCLFAFVLENMGICYNGASVSPGHISSFIVVLNDYI